ncbi:MAG: site-2 protease family protein [Oscillospiraceae bacterium]
MGDFQSWVNQLNYDQLIEMVITVLAAVICITLHEVSHGYAAYRLGDPTAKNAGRLTLNPLRHIDPLGLLVMAIAHFGWARAVPIQPGNFKHFRRDTALTALAGPAANVGITMLALMLHNTLLSLGAFWELPQGLAYLDLFFQYVAILSANLAVFNLLPIPPLDGSKVLYVTLPRGICEKLLRYERFGFFLLAVLLWTGVLDAPLNFLRSGLIRLLWPICNWPVELLLHLFH